MTSLRIGAVATALYVLAVRSTPDTNNRWPGHLARRLMRSGRGSKPQLMGVLNEGIAGNRLLTDIVGPSALARFDRDVLAQSGVTHIVLLEGINDLGLGGNGQPLPTAAEIIAGAVAGEVQGSRQPPSDRCRLRGNGERGESRSATTLTM